LCSRKTGTTSPAATTFTNLLFIGSNLYCYCAL
jgi:hypothetical protein